MVHVHETISLPNSFFNISFQTLKRHKKHDDFKLPCLDLSNTYFYTNDYASAIISAFALTIPNLTSSMN